METSLTCGIVDSGRPLDAAIEPIFDSSVSRRRARTASACLPVYVAVVIRAKRILLAAEGVPIDKIAARLDSRREVVSMWRKRFFEERMVGLEERSRPDRPRTFPPELVVQAKALACERPATHDLPLSHWNTPDITRYVCPSGLIATISDRTIRLAHGAL